MKLIVNETDLTFDNAKEGDCVEMVYAKDARKVIRLLQIERDSLRAQLRIAFDALDVIASNNVFKEIASEALEKLLAANA